MYWPHLLWWWLNLVWKIINRVTGQTRNQGDNRAIAYPRNFQKPVCLVVTYKFQSFFPPENISWFSVFFLCESKRERPIKTSRHPIEVSLVRGFSVSSRPWSYFQQPISTTAQRSTLDNLSSIVATNFKKTRCLGSLSFLTFHFCRLIPVTINFTSPTATSACPLVQPLCRHTPFFVFTVCHSRTTIKSRIARTNGKTNGGTTGSRHVAFVY